LTAPERDVINGTTPDAVIVLEGGAGTLCELTFALKAQKPVFYWNATAKLRTKLASDSTQVDQFIQIALNSSTRELTSVVGITASTTASVLQEALELGLQVKTDFSGTIEELVKKVLACIGKTLPDTTFPGFKDDFESKIRFERNVQRISTCP